MGRTFMTIARGALPLRGGHMRLRLRASVLRLHSCGVFAFSNILLLQLNLEPSASCDGMYVCMYVCSRVRDVVDYGSSALLTRCHTLVTLHISRLREMSSTLGTGNRQLLPLLHCHPAPLCEYFNNNLLQNDRLLGGLRDTLTTPLP